MLASLSATAGRSRDLDAEAAVIWPAWCYSGEGGAGGGGRRCVRDAAAPAPTHAPPAASPATATQPHTTIKSERLSPHDNNSTASRSRSVTPSTSSYPGTPPERGSPHAPATASLPPTATSGATATGPRNYSDIMRSLAARYNTQHNNYYIPRMNGFGGNGGLDAQAPALTSPVRADTVDVALGGLFTNLAKKQGGPMRVPAFPDMLDMTSTKTLLAMSRVGRGGRESRRKRYGSNSSANTVGAEHSPLDLSAASESAAKRARLSVSPSTRSDSEDRDHDRIERDCRCAEARARLSAWTVDDVCEFVNSIDICAEYVTNFREQRIDGAGLPLLTEDHLTGMLQMKLGPALKLRAVLSARLGPCVRCQNCQNGPSTPCSKVNGAIVKAEPRSNTTSPS